MTDPVDAEVPDDEALWMVRRDQFDYFLVQQAQRQGAELWQETKAKGIEFKGDRWQVETSRGPVEGRYLDRKSTRLNSSYSQQSRMPSSA